MRNAEVSPLRRAMKLHGSGRDDASAVVGFHFAQEDVILARAMVGWDVSSGWGGGEANDVSVR